MADDVLEVGFASPISPGLPVEVARHADIVERMGLDHFSTAQRPSFGVLFVVRGGSGVHTVDFDQVNLARNKMVFVRPGQLSQWHRGRSLNANVVIARAELCRVSEWFPGDASHVDLDADSAASVADLVSVLEREQARFRSDSASVRLVGDVFSALLDVFDLAAPATPLTELPEAYTAYRRAVEAGLGRSRDARWFIRDLGFSERTVTRACQLVTGLTAKGVLDQRVMLEAKRLLAHTDRPIGSIGQSLGFAEASNFNKFFARHASVIPSQFRAGLRATGWSAETPA